MDSSDEPAEAQAQLGLSDALAPPPPPADVEMAEQDAPAEAVQVEQDTSTGGSGPSTSAAPPGETLQAHTVGCCSPSKSCLEAPCGACRLGRLHLATFLAKH